MKKIIFLGVLAVFINIYSANISKEQDDKIRNWVKKTYDINQYGSSAQKMMYKQEVDSYIWLQKYADDKETLKRVMGMYKPEEYGYSAIKMMYEQEVNNNNW